MAARSDRTGLGPLEAGVIGSISALGAFVDRPYTKSAMICRHIAEHYGYGEKYAYEALCDLASPWRVVLPLVDGHGNLGSLDYPPAPSTLTECRLSAAGNVAALAESGRLGPVPIALINGTSYCGGSAPSFDPKRVVDALLAAFESPAAAAPAELARRVGPPVFPGGCTVAGDVEGLIGGRRVPNVELRAHLDIGGEASQRWIDITALPPMVAPGALVGYLADRAAGRPVSPPPDCSPLQESRPRLPLVSIEDLTVREAWGSAVRIRCLLRDGSDDAEVVEQLRREPGLVVRAGVHLPRPLGELLRTWIDAHRSDDTKSALSQLAVTL